MSKYIITNALLGSADSMESQELLAWCQHEIKGAEVSIEIEGSTVYAVAKYADNAEDFEGWETITDGYRIAVAIQADDQDEDEDQADLSRYDSFIEEDKYASDEAHLGESTLAKIRRQKELLLEDHPQSPETLAPQNGFEVVYGGWANGAGGLDNPRVVVFADRKSFEAQNPNWAAMVDDAKHRQCTPYTNLGNIYLFDRPQGGYEIYPRDGRTRADGSVAEIW